jgi:LmbE family N-acetylglucosaminyl deacetylase
MSPPAAASTPFETGRFVWLGSERADLELLIVAPHPDDEVIGPGGRARLTAEKGVGAIVVTDGARGAGGRSEPGLAALREEESIAGLRIVKATFGWFLRLRSPALQADPTGPATDAIAQAVARFRPRVVVTTSPYERHPTHLATTRAVIAALRRKSPAPALFGMPVWDPVPGSEGVTDLDVTAVVDEKLAAIRCHATQIADRPFDRTTSAQMERDGTLAQLTGSGSTCYVERYLDLGELVQPGAPPLREWLRRRFERDTDARLGAGRAD